MTRGIHAGHGEGTAEAILARLPEIGDRSGETVPEDGFAQPRFELEKAGYSATQ